MGKTYIFEDLKSLISKHLNTDEQVAMLYYNNGRVIWKVFPYTTTSNIHLSPGLLNILKLRAANSHDKVTGLLIDKSK